MEIGIKGYAETIVDQSNVASSAGSGLLDVFSTPHMIDGEGGARLYPPLSGRRAGQRRHPAGG